ncbi:hypothetical protein PBRA_008753 [Plasmodiophora brassicae]|uniref:Nudix hydrolase domain-containing protein n=1 Tax=Plasmodiophora brassicae TaxID=37360 RepID=A0A0G4J3H2_PLABS|nr:hypothetical protein PBRA_008753 [Plasmodiophora brassicae]
MLRYGFAMAHLMVDVCIVGLRAGIPHVLLIERAAGPFQNHWAFSGGSVNVSADEPLIDAAYRSLENQTSLSRNEAGLNLQPIGYRASAERDPRGYTATFLFMSHVDMDRVSHLASRSVREAWFPVNSLVAYSAGRRVPVLGERELPMSINAQPGIPVLAAGIGGIPMAFDHFDILQNEIREGFLTIPPPTGWRPVFWNLFGKDALHPFQAHVKPESFKDVIEFEGNAPGSVPDVGRSSHDLSGMSLLIVDICVLGLKGGIPHILLVKRRFSPFEKYWALPGVFVHASDGEQVKHAAQRKLGDEMSLTDVDLQPAGYSVNTRRDPRGPTATFVFTSVVDMTEVQPTLPDDAKALAWFPIRSDCIDDGGQETLDIFGLQMSNIRTDVLLWSAAAAAVAFACDDDAIEDIPETSPRPSAGYGEFRYNFAMASLSVSLCIIGVRDGVPHALLAERAGRPYSNHWILPGGRVNIAQGETLIDAAYRELEGASHQLHVEPIGYRAGAERDPRGYTVSFVFMVFVDMERVQPVAGRSFRQAWFPVRSLKAYSENDYVPILGDPELSGWTAAGMPVLGSGYAGIPMAFDHFDILQNEARAAFEKMVDESGQRGQLLWNAPGQEIRGPLQGFAVFRNKIERIPPKAPNPVPVHGKYRYDYAMAQLTADICIIGLKNDVPHILLIQRGNYPYKNYWAFPGGFLDVKDGESAIQAAHRELEEETSLTGLDLTPLGYSASAERDPRGYTATFVFISGVVDMDKAKPKAADDAKKVAWFPVHSLSAYVRGQAPPNFGSDTFTETTDTGVNIAREDTIAVPLAFDHYHILQSQVILALQDLVAPTHF